MKKKKLVVLNLFIFLPLLLIVSFLMYSSRSAELELIFAKELALFKESGNSSLDLRLLLGTSWKRVCMQHPYQHQDNFEKAINQKVYGFEYISDGVNTLWVFYNDGTAKWLQIKQVAVMDWDYSTGTQCTSFKYPILYSHWVKYVLWPSDNKFYFLDNDNVRRN